MLSFSPLAVEQLGWEEPGLESGRDRARGVKGTGALCLQSPCWKTLLRDGSEENEIVL